MDTTEERRIAEAAYQLGFRDSEERLALALAVVKAAEAFRNSPKSTRGRLYKEMTDALDAWHTGGRE